MLQTSRFVSDVAAGASPGWTLERLTPPSALFGANGMRAYGDGRVLVAQCVGSQISAVNVDTGEVEVVNPMGADLVGVDDIALGPNGVIFATEVMNARVGVREANGRTRVLRGDLPLVNGITFHQGRLFVDECRHGGRVMELDLNGGEPRVLVDGIGSGNALEVGPDGMLYYPVMEANEIWRVHPDGGTPELVAGGLGIPDSVKFDSKGYIVSTQVGTGEVLRIDPQTGDKTVLANIYPGLDNLTFVGERLFVSTFRGEVVEVLARKKTRSVFAGALAFPLGLAVDGDRLFVADGPTLFSMPAAGGDLHQASTLFSPQAPGYMRGLALSASGELVVSTANGTVSRYRPDAHESELLASGLDQVYGVAIAPGGAVIAADLGAGRVVSIEGGVVTELARDLKAPRGVAVTAGGDVLVTESGAGRVIKVAGGRTETVLDGLQNPQGILVRGDMIYVVDSGARSVVAYDLVSRSRSVIATGLPVGSPAGVNPKPLLGFPPLSGPMGPFAGIAGGADGSLYIAADGDGSVLALRPATD